MAVRGQFTGVGICLLHTTWILGLTSGHQAWQQTPLPTELSCQPPQLCWHSSQQMLVLSSPGALDSGGEGSSPSPRHHNILPVQPASQPHKQQVAELEPDAMKPNPPAPEFLLLFLPTVSSSGPRLTRVQATRTIMAC